MDIKIPHSFHKIASAFYSGALVDNPDPLDIVKKILDRFRSEERSELREFMVFILGHNFTSEDRNKIWSLSCRDYYISENGCDFLYNFIVQELDAI